MHKNVFLNSYCNKFVPEKSINVKNLDLTSMLITSPQNGLKLYYRHIGR